ncbi:site-specific DNA-methyltransferase [Paraburkholderia sp. J10-1]|uniref:DNA-methyltransferase n=1 Tax=Paraburkholderia sp. J10-1 TaxID=2805430 RepID=UPI002AB7C3A4|nr:site-specific DNA-methyltransferase [Paraburkholderia sp. J10-1]
MGLNDWLDRCHFGDCRDTMRAMIADGVKVQTCVTSPPYYGLRDYGHAGQFGLEETPALYIEAMVEVFRAVRDVLADDGTLWLNIGDSYAGSWGSQGRQGNTGQMAGRSVANVRERSKIQAARIEAGAYPAKMTRTSAIPEASGLKPKDLIGIPWMLAFALRADGWYLRSDIIWSKGNPMPESVTDRPTKSHEYLFLLSKSERYHYNHEAIKEPAVSEHASGNGFKRDARLSYMDANGARGNDEHWTDVGGSRNRRSVWNINTQPYKGAHFATFPEGLVEPCVLAGSRAGDVVFDPFFGSGTSGRVAQRLGRSYIGLELNCEYEPLQRDRLRQPSLPLEIGSC